jgi:tetratricopeptide (TPR) repeat protein
MASNQYSVEVRGSVQGLVQGDGNVVTLIYQNGSNRTVPFLAPTRAPHVLIGRDDLLTAIKESVISRRRHTPSVLTGLPGAGKTTLAVELAHDPAILSEFGDGVLWAGLGPRGDVQAQLGTWAAAVGVAQQEMEKLQSARQWAAATHSAIGTRRMLLIVDDAWTAEDALAFHLGGPNCAHVLTTRLREVAAQFSDETIFTVSDLLPTDGLELLARFAPDVVQSERNSCLDLVRAVGGLPLALLLIGKKLQFESRTGQPRRVRQALALLSKAQERLKLTQTQPLVGMHPGLASPNISLATVIGLSESQLDVESRTAFLQCSTFPPKPASFSEEAAVAVIQQGPEVLDRLTDSGLIETAGPGRYRFHQTISDYARSQRTDVATEKRMIHFFLELASKCSSDHAMFDLELSNLLACLEITVQNRFSSELPALLNSLFEFMIIRGMYATLVPYLNEVGELARANGNVAAHARWCFQSGQTNYRLGRLAAAELYFQEGLSLTGLKQVDSQRLLQGLGWLRIAQGNYADAVNHLSEAVRLAPGAGNSRDRSSALAGLGVATAEVGEYREAESYLEEALELARDIGDVTATSEIVNHLGRISYKKGQFDTAESFWTEGLSLSRQLGIRMDISNHVGSLAVIRAKRGEVTQARILWDEGLSIAREIRHSELVCTHLMNMGWAALTQQNSDEAVNLLVEARKLAEEVGLRSQMSFILANLAFVIPSVTDADVYMIESLAIARRIKRRWLITKVLCLDGEYALSKNRDTVATEYFREVLNTSEFAAHAEHRAMAFYGLAKVAARQGDLASVGRFSDAAMRYFESQRHYLGREVCELFGKALPETKPNEI